MTRATFTALAIDRFEEHPVASPRHAMMTIVAQDPSVRRWDAAADATHAILRAEVRVPADRFEPGPAGHRFRVVDFDASQSHFTTPAGPLLDTDGRYVDAFKDAPDSVLETDPAFLAQNAYAIAARTLDTFESALGRRLPWAFGSHQLFIVPRAFAEPNAYYANDDEALYFGYFPEDPENAPTKHVYACLSHDVVAHETTHAVLDGLRPRYEEPSLPDQPAFHEAFADIVALLSLFSVPEVVKNALGPVAAGSRDGRVPASAVAPEALRESVLFILAEQMGKSLDSEQAHGLRHSVGLPIGDGWKCDRTFQEPHRRGEVLVAAMMRALLRMWSERLVALIAGERVDRARAAEEGAKAADHLLKMAIRAIDYTPPVELEFVDFLDALLTSDEVMAPDDEHNYRTALRDSFADYGLVATPERVVDLSKRERPPECSRLNFAALRTSTEEVFRFLWENAAFFGLDTRFHLRVEDVTPTVRVGPDGFVVSETIATYVQSVRASATELKRLSGGELEVPETVAGDTSVELWGGGVVIFDQFGTAKFHAYKSLLEWKRQSERLAYLVRTGLRDRSGGYGASLGTPRGQRFAELHISDRRAGEVW